MEAKSTVSHGREVSPLAGTVFVDLSDIETRLRSLANRAERLHESAFGRPELYETADTVGPEEIPTGVIGHVNAEIVALSRAASRIEAVLANFETAFGASK